MLSILFYIKITEVKVKFIDQFIQHEKTFFGSWVKKHLVHKPVPVPIPLTVENISYDPE
jgi:hypothetical protein